MSERMMFERRVSKMKIDKKLLKDSASAGEAISILLENGWTPKELLNESNIHLLNGLYPEDDVDMIRETIKDYQKLEQKMGGESISKMQESDARFRKYVEASESEDEAIERYARERETSGNYELFQHKDHEALARTLAQEFHKGSTSESTIKDIERKIIKKLR